MPTRRDSTTWMFLHDGMPDHPKIESLSDRAFRSLIELWCYCSRHLTDGYVTETAWLKRTTPKVRRELIDADLVDVLPTESRQDPIGKGVVMHDYLDWQRSAAEAAEFSSKKASAGSYGNHQRWHVAAGKRSSDCKFCADDDPGKGSQDLSQVRSQVGSQTESQVGSQTDRTRIAEKSREESGSFRGKRPVSNARVARRPPPPDDQIGMPMLTVIDGGTTRCAEHAPWPADRPVPRCIPCRDARLRAEADQASAASREAARQAAFRAAVDACPDCDHNGMTHTSPPHHCACSAHLRHPVPEPSAPPGTLRSTGS